MSDPMQVLQKPKKSLNKTLAGAEVQVSVLVELKARFDEARNVGYAQRLEDAGCNVAYGLIGLKTHCKLMLVSLCLMQCLAPGASQPEALLQGQTGSLEVCMVCGISMRNVDRAPSAGQVDSSRLPIEESCTESRHCS